MRSLLGITIGNCPSTVLVIDGKIQLYELEEKLQNRIDIFGFPSLGITRAIEQSRKLGAEPSEVVFYDGYWPVTHFNDVKELRLSSRDEHFARISGEGSLDLHALIVELGLRASKARIVSREEGVAGSAALLTNKEEGIFIIFDSELLDADLVILSMKQGKLTRLHRFNTGLVDLFNTIHRRYGLSFEEWQNSTTEKPAIDPFDRLDFDPKSAKLADMALVPDTVDIGDDHPIIMPLVFVEGLDELSDQEKTLTCLDFLSRSIEQILRTHLDNFENLNPVYSGNMAIEPLIAPLLKKSGGDLVVGAAREAVGLGLAYDSLTPEGRKIKAPNFGSYFDQRYSDLFREVLPGAKPIGDRPETLATYLKNNHSIGVLSGRASWGLAEYGNRSVLIPFYDKERAVRLRGLFRKMSESNNGTILAQFGPFIDCLDSDKNFPELPDWPVRLIDPEGLPEYAALLNRLPEKAVFHFNLSRNAQIATSYLSDAVELMDLGLFDYLLVDCDILEVPEKRRAMSIELLEGIDRFNHDKDMEAQDLFQKILAKDPDNPIARFYMGNLYYLRKNYYESLGHMSQALIANPLLANAYFIATNLLLTLNYFKEALNTAALFSRYCFDQLEAGFQMALAFKNLGLFQDAYRVLELVSRRAPFDKKYLDLLKAWSPLIKKIYLSKELPSIVQFEVFDNGEELDLKLYNEVLNQFPFDHPLKIVLAGKGNILDSTNLDLYINDCKVKKGQRICEIIVDITQIENSESVSDRLLYTDVDRVSLVCPGLLSDNELKMFSEIKNGFSESRTITLDAVLPSLRDDDQDFIAIQKNLFEHFNIVLSGNSLKGGISSSSSGAEPFEHHLKQPCLAPFYSLTVNKNGFYRPCWQSLDDCSVALGRITTTAILGLWSSRIMNEIRQQQVNIADTPLSQCRGCTYCLKFPSRVVTSEDLPYGSPPIERLKEFALFYNEKEMTNATLTVLQQISVAEPEYASCYFDLGDLYMKVKDYEKAIEQYRLGLKYEPGNVEIRFRLSEIYYTLGNLDASKNVLLEIKNELK